MVITSDTIRILDNNHKETWLMHYRLDANQKPRSITMTIAEGEGKGKTAEGKTGQHAPKIYPVALPGITFRRGSLSAEIQEG